MDFISDYLQGWLPFTSPEHITYFRKFLLYQMDQLIDFHEATQIKFDGDYRKVNILFFFFSQKIELIP